MSQYPRMSPYHRKVVAFAAVLMGAALVMMCRLPALDAITITTTDYTGPENHVVLKIDKSGWAFCRVPPGKKAEIEYIPEQSLWETASLKKVVETSFHYKIWKRGDLTIAIVDK